MHDQAPSSRIPSLIATAKDIGQALELPLSGELAECHQCLLQSVRAEDISARGIEDRPHVTVVFGVRPKDFESVRGIIEAHGPVTVFGGPTACFTSRPANGMASDILHVEIESDELRRLHERISAEIGLDQSRGYRPHMTIAFLKAGAGRRYEGDPSCTGRRETVARVEFMMRAADGQRLRLPIDFKAG